MNADTPCVVATLLDGGAVLDLRLARPKANILDRAMMTALSVELQHASENAALRLVILRGTGGHFSFGASVEEHRKADAPAMLRTFHGLVRQVGNFPVPVVALVEGQCLGGAFELALVCHMLFAVPGAVFGCPEIKLGVMPPVLAAVGAQRLGGALAERLLLTGDPLRAEEAAAMGLVTLLGGEGDALVRLMSWYAAHVKPLSAFALRQGVRAFRRGLLQALGDDLDRAERQYLDEILPSHDGNEGIEAFIARRPPHWTNS